ncbi:MAG: chemotaxis protein CheA [Brevinematia bacterium]
MDFSEELVKDFLSEAFELVDSLEKNLLLLENDPNNTKSINEIFRAIHTIKGGSATVGFNEIKDFTHIFEDVLDMIRKGKLLISREYISKFLECKDEIEKMLSAREKETIYTSEKKEKLLEFLQNIKGGQIEKKPAPTAEEKTPDRIGVEEFLDKSKLTNYEISTISEIIAKGKRVFVLHYYLNDKYEMRDVAPFQINALLKDISEILKVIPDLNKLETSFHRNVYFIIASDKTEKDIREKTFLQEMVEKLLILPLTDKLLEGFRDRNLKKVAENKDNLKNEKTEEEKRATSTIRIESWKVDELLNLMGELVITKASFSDINEKFDGLENIFKNHLKSFLSGVSKLKLDNDPKKNEEKNFALLASFEEIFQMFDAYRETFQKLSRVSSSLQENVMNLRMVPVQMIFSRFPRLVRDMSEKMNKDVDLIMEGVETEIDKSMVDEIFDPLVHIIRNSLDHGIESKEERIKLGKSPRGKIILKAYHEGDSIVIEESDDGKGIDFEVLRKKALENKMFPKEVVEKMSPKELLALIFLPGFSTAGKITEISGRGVGMDVVKKKVEELGGNVSFYTAKNKGSRIVIRLPLTLAIIQGLLVEVEDIHFFIPISSIEETIVVSKEDFKDINGRKMIFLRESLIPLIFLEEFFYQKSVNVEEVEKKYCIVVKSKEKNFGLVVDNVIGEQDVVIKPLNNKLVKASGISAATIIGNGDIAFIVDVERVTSLSGVKSSPALS